MVDSLHLPVFSFIKRLFVEEFSELKLLKGYFHVSRVPSGKSSVRALLSIKPRKTIYHCKADKLKFAKISIFFILLNT